jgi:hypothetical protein
MPMTNSPSTGNRILMIGLHPSALDYGWLPGLDETILTARIEAGNRRSGKPDSMRCPVR